MRGTPRIVRQSLSKLRNDAVLLPARMTDGDRSRDQRFPGVANPISSKIPGTLLSRIDDSSIEMRVLAQTSDRFDRLIERACAKIVATRTPDLLEG